MGMHTGPSVIESGVWLASVSEKAHFERATTVRYWPSESRWTDEWRADQPIKTLVRHHQKGPGERSETKGALPVNNPSQVNLHKHLTSSKQILFTKIFPSIHHQTSPNTSSWFVPFKKFINVGLFFSFFWSKDTQSVSVSFYLKTENCSCFLLICLTRFPVFCTETQDKLRAL